MLYIWPWQAPELPPLRLISSMITDASARPRPGAAVLLRESARPASRPWSARRRSSRDSRAARRSCGEYSSGNCAQRSRTASRMSWCVGRVRHGIGSVISTESVSAAWRSPRIARLALRSARPQPHCVAARRQAAADARTVQVEQRAHRAELEASATSASGRSRAQQVDQQRGDQRAVHDQARIALDLGHVAAVVVDAVAVEGQRRVAEQQHVVGHDAARELLVGGSAGAALRRRRSPARGASR